MFPENLQIPVNNQLQVDEYVDVGWEGRAKDMVDKTWRALQNGGNGRVYQSYRDGGFKLFRKTKRSLNTYWNTHHTERSKTVEALVGIGVGIGIAILSSSVLAASVGTFGALPIAMAIGILIALLSKQIFKMYRNFVKKRLALEWLGKIEDGTAPDPKLENDDVAATFICELYKDIPKLQIGKKKYIYYALKQDELNRKGKISRFDQVRLGFKNLKLRDLENEFPDIKMSTKLHTNSEYEETDPKKLRMQLAVRVRRVIAYSAWLDKYFDVLRIASQELQANDQGQGLTDTEDQVMELAELQVSASGIHGPKVCKQCCFGPPPPPGSGWQKIPLPENERPKFFENSEVMKRMKELKLKNLSQLQDQPHLHEEGDSPQVGFDELKDVSLDNVVGQVQGLPYSILTNDHILSHAVDPLVNLITHGTQGFDANLIGGVSTTSEELLKQAGGAFVASAVFAPASFLISQGLALLLENLRHNRKVQNKVSKMRNNLMTNLDENNMKKELEEMAKDLDQTKVLRALEMSANHYPKRIEARLEKLKKKCEDVKSRAKDNVIQLKGCDEAQEMVRYVLKINNNIEKQILNVAILQIWVKILVRHALQE